MEAASLQAAEGTVMEPSEMMEAHTGTGAPSGTKATWQLLVPVTVDPRVPYGGPTYRGCQSCRRQRAVQKASDFEEK